LLGLVALGLGPAAGPLRADVPLYKLRHDGPAVAAVFAADGKTLVTVRTVRFWGADTGQKLRRIEVKEPVALAAFAPDGKFVAVAGETALVQLYDLASGKPGQPLNGYGGPVSYIGFSGVGTLAVCAQHLFFWDVATRQNRNLIAIGSHGTIVCALSLDGRQVAYAPAGGTLQVQDIAGFRSTGYDLRNITALTFSPDNKFLAVGMADKSVRLMTEGRGEVGRLNTDEPAVALAFSADSKTVATGGGDGTIRLFDAAGKEQRRLIGHRAAIAGLAFAPDGRLLASASADGTVRVWELAGEATAAPPPSLAGPGDAEQLWGDLLADDPAVSRRAFRGLAAAPALTVPLVRDRLRSVARLSVDDQVRTWLANLDDDSFAVRQRANAELARLGPSADPALRQALATASSVEVQRRIERLLGPRRATPLAPEARRGLEGLELLVEIGTPEARRALQDLSQASLAVPFGPEVSSALERLDKRTKPVR
jgi:hypothetical protein